jgi:hypothetical protein
MLGSVPASRVCGEDGRGDEEFLASSCLWMLSLSRGVFWCKGPSSQVAAMCVKTAPGLDPAGHLVAIQLVHRADFGAPCALPRRALPKGNRSVQERPPEKTKRLASRLGQGKADLAVGRQRLQTHRVTSAGVRARCPLPARRAGRAARLPSAELALSHHAKARPSRACSPRPVLSLPSGSPQWAISTESHTQSAGC